MLAAESLVFLTYDDNGVYVVISRKSRSTRKVDVTGGLSPSVIIRIEGSPRLSVGDAVIEDGRLVLLARGAQLGGKAAAQRVRACPRTSRHADVSPSSRSRRDDMSAQARSAMCASASH